MKKRKNYLDGTVKAKEILKCFDTCDLVRELESRDDVVKTKYVQPYDVDHFDVEGPAVVLITID